MKNLPGILFLLFVLLSPFTAWADDAADAGGSSAEQSSNGSAGDKKGEGEEEEPDCE